MKDYTEMSLEELKALKEQREKEALARELMAADEEAKNAELEAHDTEVAEKAIQNYIDSLNVEQPEITKEEVKSKSYSTREVIGEGSNAIVFTEDDLADIASMYKEFGIEDKMWEYGAPNTPEFHNPGASFNYTDADSGCEDALSNWQVSENFCNLIWHAKEVYGNLGRICATVCEPQAGDNALVNIKVISARSDPQAKGAGECLSCVSNTFTKYTITVSQYGDYAVLNSFDEFKTGSSYRRAVIKSMAQHWGVWFDKKIYAALIASSPGYTETLNNTLDCNGSISGSCCTNGSDIYGRLLDLDARMRAAGYNPDYLIVSPTVANYFKYLQTPGNSIANISVKVNGTVLTKVGHLNVIEYGGATACSTATATKFAWLVDSSRAIGQAFGKHPTLEFDRSAECNAWKLVFWAYWGVSVLDTNAIGAIQSPNS